jgi:hypothetical protein
VAIYVDEGGDCVIVLFSDGQSATIDDLKRKRRRKTRIAIGRSDIAFSNPRQFAKACGAVLYKTRSGFDDACRLYRQQSGKIIWD